MPAPISLNSAPCSNTRTARPLRASASAAARPPIPPPSTITGNMIALKFYLPEFGARVRNLSLSALVLASVVLGGCASLIAPQSTSVREHRPADIPPRAELKSVPFFPQTEYQCGPAALATVLANAKVKVKPDDLVSQVYVPERRGSFQVEMLAAARRHGMI